MDKIIEGEILVRKKRKMLSVILLIAVVLVTSVLLLRFTLKTSVKKSALSIAVVERGNIENTINGSGEVLPEFEEIVTSPITASIQNVTLNAGSEVDAGQSILTLDKSAAQTELEKMKFRLESKKNDIRKLRLDLDKSFYDIRSSDEIKQLRINSMIADVENAKRLFKAGGGTREDIEKAELNLKVARLEKLQLENEIRNKQQTMQVAMKEAEIALSIQESELKELQRKFQLAEITAGRTGVVTWVNKNIGATVLEGEALARIANLSSFKILGSISDNFLGSLHLGQTAIVRVNDSLFRGSIVNIQPAVKNNIVTFDVKLNESNNQLLRPNMKLDVYVVTSSQDNILRVANGPAFKGAATQNIFVVEGNIAKRRKVQTGMRNFDFVEIKGNVKPGDSIIISDMSAYLNAQEITIQ